MLPEKFLDRMQKMLGEEYDAFLETFGQNKYQALRLNPLKKGMDGLSAAEKLAGAAERQKTAEEPADTVEGQEAGGNLAWGTDRGFAHLTEVPWARDGYYYQEGDQPGKHPYHEAGLYYIQEPSAMMPAELLDVKPGERVLDLCAAPGGKSTQIAAKLRGKGLLISNEINPARARILSENIERMGICNACVTNEAPERLSGFFPEYFDRVMVDAPCSGEGMFRKNEMACEEWSPENVTLCAGRQDRILDCAAQMLRPGGTLVYSTCTFAPEENEGSVKRFLHRHKDFFLRPLGEETLAVLQAGERAGRGCRSFGVQVQKEMPETEGTLRLWPHRVKGEGHFAAVLGKADSDAEKGRRTGEGVRGMREKELQEVEGLADFFRESLRLSTLPPDKIPAGRETGTLREPKSKEKRNEKENIRRRLTDLGKILGMGEETVCIRFGDHLYLVPGEMPSLKGLKVLRPGLHIGEARKNRFEPSHALALALPPDKAAHTWLLSREDGRVSDYLKGGTFPAEGEKGWYLVCVDGFGMGWGKLAGGIMKNHYPRGLRKN